MVKYTNAMTLGKDAYNCISKAKDERGNEIYAMKEFGLRDEKEAKNKDIISIAIREVYLLKELIHINI